MRCGKCGNENDEANRFCGMCGADLAAGDRARGQAVSSSGARASSAPVITGPSFLGLNTPAAETGSGRSGVDDVSEARGEGGRDMLRPSANVDYLLEDEDERRGGWGKWILVLVALGLAVGFGYLHWKSGGFDWLNAGDKKPAAVTAQTPDGGQSGADSGGTAGAAAPASGTAAPAGAGGGVTGLPAGGAAGGAGSAAESGGAPTTSTQTASQTSSQTSSQDTASQPAASQSTDRQNTPQTDAGDSNAPASGSKAASSDSDEPSAPAETTPRAVARKPAAATPAAAKPSAARAAAARPVDSVTEAERYLYGRGVAQDCDHGLRLLKPAAEQSDVKAMISLGALYSTGTCTPRDLPTAYRWFALALHKEPDNQVLQADLQNLWSKMTPPERQLAIKLSQ